MPTKPTARAKQFGPREIRFSIAPDTPFEEMVGVLEKALTIPDIGRFKGCAPCMSGLEKFVFEDFDMRQFSEMQR